MADGSAVFLMLSSAAGRPGSIEAGSQYWWKTTGRDLANMLRAAQYPKETQRIPVKSWTWDGSTHEYSFELKESIKTLGVRFVADFSPLRPVNWADPLDSTGTEAAIASFASCVSGFDDTYLITEAGHMTPFLIGFDISRKAPAGAGTLPVLGKAYFLPCIAAVAQMKTRFEVICAGIRQLPDIFSRPNILSSLRLVEEYLASKPKDWENGARYLATDFVTLDKARLKIYLRCPGTSFDDIWDYFTLGGRIPGMDNVKDRYRQFVNLLGGGTEAHQGGDPKGPSAGIETANRRKLTTTYFSLDNKYPFPAPKVAFCGHNFAANDALVAQGLDRWLQRFGWDDANRSIEDLVRHSLPVGYEPAGRILGVASGAIN
ncbi:hypothetical protein DL766_007610 [Monosporascus sp. MC13-8B]|uniref:Uncharacterized protein n=1 Tax=Monosporascus cannonballus TaxID=155416 RepID=A0ABY0GVW5_9PEZI|nr:hypothetical protein DL762_008774 [Monosporascus cannonballus]RYO82504.1 hypothetical protein DL763_008217 [Monosporascus cannonballus]RYP22890.1 hypothetical protein DL766_007610 [Monosporascus sp. MC13-8B]